MKKISIVKITRSGGGDCIYYKGDCVNCTRDCPFTFCQNEENCMACKNRMLCPMCNGECSKCQYKSTCKILWLREEAP